MKNRYDNLKKCFVLMSRIILLVTALIYSYVVFANASITSITDERDFDAVNFVDPSIPGFIKPEEANSLLDIAKSKILDSADHKIFLSQNSLTEINNKQEYRVIVESRIQGEIHYHLLPKTGNAIKLNETQIRDQLRPGVFHLYDAAKTPPPASAPTPMSTTARVPVLAGVGRSINHNNTDPDTINKPEKKKEANKVDLPTFAGFVKYREFPFDQNVINSNSSNKKAKNKKPTNLAPTSATTTRAPTTTTSATTTTPTTATTAAPAPAPAPASTSPASTPTPTTATTTAAPAPASTSPASTPTPTTATTTAAPALTSRNTTIAPLIRSTSKKDRDVKKNDDRDAQSMTAKVEKNRKDPVLEVGRNTALGNPISEGNKLLNE